MCRSIKQLRGTRPATDDEVRAAARQFVRKVSGVREPAPKIADAFEAAVAEITATTDRLLAGLPASRADREEVLATPLKRFTPYTIVAPGLLRQALREVRRTGVAYAREEMTVGRTSIAVPVIDRTNQAVAALSIVLPSTSPAVDRLEPALRTAGRCASRQLRGQPSPCPPLESDPTPHSH